MPPRKKSASGAPTAKKKPALVKGPASARGRKKPPAHLRASGMKAAMIASAFVAVAAVLTVLLLVLKPDATPPVPAKVTTAPAAPAVPAPVQPSVESPIADDPLPPPVHPDPADREHQAPSATAPIQVAPAAPGARLPAAPPEKAPAAPAPEKPGARGGQPPVVPPKSVEPKVAPRTIARSFPVASKSPRERPQRPLPRKKAHISFVIDDAGNNLRELEPFMRLPFRYTVAVLPGLPHSAEAARRLRASGAEVILHQPMEAIGGQDPGPGAIYSGMSAEKVRAILEKNLKEVGPVVGMNNHQGSKITKDAAIMKVVLAFCRDHGIYYLDSKTTADSVVPELARRMGIHIKERDVFIDNIQERSSMMRYVQDGMQKAEKKGAAVMIGHAWSNELADTLQSLYPELVEQGFSLTTISQLMMGKWDDEGSGD